jgi:hypothetical protein
MQVWISSELINESFSAVPILGTLLKQPYIRQVLETGED